MAHEDPEAALTRLVDNMMLEKVKQMRASDFKGLDLIHGAPSREDLERVEAEIASRYSAEDLRNMRRFGFTGVSVEQRANETENEDLYNIIYRNLSRNVHSTDYMEHYLHQGILSEERRADYYLSRDSVMMESCFISTGPIISAVNLTYGCEHDSELKAVLQKREAISRS